MHRGMMPVEVPQSLDVAGKRGAGMMRQEHRCLRRAGVRASAPELVSERLEISLTALRGLARRIWRIPRAVELVHDVRVGVRLFHRVEDRLQVHLALAEWAVALEVLPT